MFNHTLELLDKPGSAFEIPHTTFIKNYMLNNSVAKKP